jgi:hypothetical protein
VIEQGRLFELPPRRGRGSGWTDLDRLRARRARIARRIAETGGNDRELEELARIERKLSEREREGADKWKKSFGS